MPGGAGTIRWILTDPVTLDTYDFDINPNDGGEFNETKNITYINTAGPDGRTLAFEGRDSTRQTQVSGTILNEAHLDALFLWSRKRYTIQVTDDLERTFDIYITDFQPKRRRSALYQWKHDYTLTYVLMS